MEFASQQIRPSPLLPGKFRGALVGAAVGDALGAPFEGASSVEWSDVRRLEHEPGPLRYTDDTHMTLGVAQSLVEREGFDGAHMAALFARNYMRQPWRGYGPGPPHVFRLLGQGVPWDQAGHTLFDGGGSFGNGAAMRVAPAALLAFRNIGQAVSIARRTAAITHTHELGIEGAVLQACGVVLALRQDPAEVIDGEVFLDALLGLVRAPVYRQKLERIKELLVVGGRLDRRAIVDRLGNGIEAFESVPAAIYAFLRRPFSFTDAVTYAIGLGGDTDTIASMTGALAGAHLGLEGTPAAWSERVEGAEQLRGLADSLLSLALGAPA